MSGTPTVTTLLLDRLTSDTAVTGLLTGGVYDRELKSAGPGSTVAAWSPEGQPRPAAVVVESGDNADPLGPGGAYQAFPWVYLYAPRTANGKATVANAWDAMFTRLHGWRFAAGAGTGASVTVVGRLGLRDDQDDTARVVDGMRLQVTGLWRITD